MKTVNLLLPLLLLPVLAGTRAQSPVPDAVERAIAEAEARYDPRRPAREEWRLITPSREDALTKKQREMFADMQAESGAMADRAVMTSEDITEHGEVEPGGPVAALRNDNHQVGRLLVVRVNDRRMTVNSDFERVEVGGDEGAVE